MSPATGRPVLLVEALGTPGSDAADARLRSAVLRHAGASVRELVLSGVTPADSGAGKGPLAAELKAAFEESRPSLVVIAASREATEVVLSLLPPIEARWWPTELLDLPGPAGRNGRVATPLFADAGEHPALDTAPVLPPPPRDRVGLWDGDYALVPAPFGGADGSTALASFAAVVENAHGLDLVVLADPQPGFVQEAERLGISTRVHFAGPAPRTAEHTWFSSATVALIAGDEPVAASQMLRALAGGCPLLPVGRSRRSRTVADWLASHGCLPAPVWSGGEDLAARLEGVLDRDVATRRAIERGRALASRHLPPSLSGRLAGGLGGAAERSREVA